MKHGLMLTWLAWATVCTTAWADGGAIVVSERVGDWQVSVLAAPTAPTVGPADVSVLVQETVSGQTIDGLAVQIDLAPENSPAERISLTATRAAATNKLFYAAQCELPTAGRWMINATVSGGDHEAKVSGVVDVAGPPPAWVELWPWIGWPAVVIALFIVRERLVCSERARRSGRAALANV